MADNFTNNAQAKLKTALSAGTTTLVLEDGYGALFPLTNFAITLEQYDVSNRVIKREIAYCTNRADDALTITRAWDSCPLAYNSTTQQQVALSFAI